MAYEDLPLHRPDPLDPPRRDAASVLADALGRHRRGRRDRGRAPDAVVDEPRAAGGRRPGADTATEVALGSKRPKGQNLGSAAARRLGHVLSRAGRDALEQPDAGAAVRDQRHRARPTLAVVQIGDGKTPASPLAMLRPAQPAAHRRQSSGRVEPVTYIRWDSAVGALSR